MHIRIVDMVIDLFRQFEGFYMGFLLTKESLDLSALKQEFVKEF